MMKLGQKKFGKSGSSTSLRQASWKSLAVSCNVQVWGLSLVGVCSVGVLLFCFVFVDMRVFVSKTLQLSFRPSGGDGDHHHPNSYHLQEALMVVSDSASFVEEEDPPPPPPLTTIPSTNLTHPRDEDEEAAAQGSIKQQQQQQQQQEEEEEHADVHIANNFEDDVDDNTAATTTTTTRGAASEVTEEEEEEEDDDDDDIRIRRSGLLRQKKKKKKTKTKKQKQNHTTSITKSRPSPEEDYCNLSVGKWVYDESYPLYRSKNCPFADPGFRCEENGRPDLDYLKYRWQPHECDLPRFNATETLERLRNQRMVFVGDSIGRNHWESMLCMLAEGVASQDKESRIYEINGETISKHTGFLAFRFKDYNLTVEYYREPFLIPQTRPPPHSHPNVTCALIVDTPCWSFSKWIHADILVFNAGHWWTDQKIHNQGCYFQEGNEINMDMDLETAFTKSMQTLGTWLDAELSPKTQVFFRSFASVHFRGGAWNTGGHCHKEVHPMSEEEARAEWATPWTNMIMRNEVRRNMKKRKDAVTYLDVTTATNYRSDGHAGLYYRDNSVTKTPNNKQDCSHFCLPGVPDTWNELLVATLLSKGKGTWGQPVRF